MDVAYALFVSLRVEHALGNLVQRPEQGALDATAHVKAEA
jgi:hypothetical protein